MRLYRWYARIGFAMVELTMSFVGWKKGIDFASGEEIKT